jgi:hypothetical protein
MNDVYGLADCLGHQLMFAILMYAMFVYMILAQAHTVACCTYEWHTQYQNWYWYCNIVVLSASVQSFKILYRTNSTVKCQILSVKTDC